MRVAVRGDEDGTVAETLADAGNALVPPADATAQVAVGADALRESVLASLAEDRESGTDEMGEASTATDEENPAPRSATPPVVPVAVDAGHYAVSRPSLPQAAASLAAGEGRTESHPVLSVSLDGEAVGRALLDVTLMTSEPARISEYAVSVGAERVAEFRADGVVVATPLGSPGYARAAGGPVLAPNTGVCIVPVSPFATRTDVWVAPAEVTASVERDEDEVSLYLDGSEAGTVDPAKPVRLAPAASIDLLRLPAPARRSDPT